MCTSAVCTLGCRVALRPSSSMLAVGSHRGLVPLWLGFLPRHLCLLPQCRQRTDKIVLEETCRQCPTRTLRSQCPHTPEGREYQKQQRNVHQPVLSQASPLPPSYRWLLPQTGVADTSLWHFPSHWPLPAPPIEPISYQIEAPGRSNLATLFPSDSQAPAPVHVLSSVPVPTSETSQSDVFGTVSTSTAAAPSRPDHERDSDSDTAPRSGPHRRQRNRATQKNPIYGLVNGARRGNQIFKVVRGKPLRPALEDQSDTSARFLRCVSDIIDRCEHVSEETGCWLHVSAQHMFGQGGYLHYTSPRFLKEAKKDAEQIINHFNQTFASLMAARNQESKNMHQRLLLAEEHKEAASVALAAAQQAEHDAIRQAEDAQRMRDLPLKRLQPRRWSSLH
ncbi:hypothetical protein K438DRAFT_357386 [Mycena galopus ATCC 62051]|nr:hypothetical protein K438DRAFT_357386 [Mycena galopus ATCC 62051]